jgi:molybdenum cofactor cytidylyltransferase
MRLIRCGSASALEELEIGAILCHDVRDPDEPRRVALRKGQRLNATDLMLLQDLAPREVHLAVSDPDDVREDEAATAIAMAVAGQNVSPAQPHNGQVNLVSSIRGWLRVNESLVERVNRIDGALLFTSVAERAADVGDVVAGVKCSPLVMAQADLARVRDVVGDAPAVDVIPFPTRRVALVALDRLGETTVARAREALSAAVHWYGSTLDPVLVVPPSDGAPTDAFRTALALGSDAILVAGASATDPMDAAFEGLRAAGGSVDQIGIPIEPGTACWTGRLEGRQVLGLASCELFGRPGAFDLLLPRLLLGQSLDRALLARLGAGGLIDSLPAHRNFEQA